MSLPPSAPLLLPDLPLALDALARQAFPGRPVLARRRLLAPEPYLDFCAAYDARDLWRAAPAGQQPPQQRAAWERLIGTGPGNGWFADESQPFFRPEGTTGRLVQSPFPELADGEFWVYVMLCGQGDPAAARRCLDEPLAFLGNVSARTYLAGHLPRWRQTQQQRRAPVAGWLGRALDHLVPDSATPDPRRTVYEALTQAAFPNYS